MTLPIMTTCWVQVHKASTLSGPMLIVFIKAKGVKLEISQSSIPDSITRILERVCLRAYTPSSTLAGGIYAEHEVGLFWL